MDFEVVKSTRTCAVTGREIAAGETYHSVLLRDGAVVKRLDYSQEGWSQAGGSGPPADSIGFWTSVMPAKDGANKPKLAPSEVLLQLFYELADSPEKQDLRYVLTLLLIRRRLLRLEETVNEASCETMVLYCPRDEQTYRVVAASPPEARVQEIQDYLSGLLFAPAG